MACARRYGRPLAMPVPPSTGPTAPAPSSTRRVVVTGASGAIGGAVARVLSSAGHTVIAHAHTRPERTHALVDEGAAAFSVSADLTACDDVEQMWSQIVEHTGAPTDLVVNAGIWPAEPTPLADLEFTRWQATLAADLTAPFLCCRAFLRSVRDAGTSSSAPDDSPSIVLIGSTAGMFGEAGHADYAAAKAGLGGLLRSLKNEIVTIAPRGRANMVSPGWVRTPMAEPASRIRTSSPARSRRWRCARSRAPKTSLTQSTS